MGKNLQTHVIMEEDENKVYVPKGMKDDLSENISYDFSNKKFCKRIYYERFVVDNAARDIIILPIRSIYVSKLKENVEKNNEERMRINTNICGKYISEDLIKND